MLNVQKYLKNGNSLEKLEEEFGIKYNEYITKNGKSLIILSYGIDMATKNSPIVVECRGIVLEKDTWNVINMPFRRFFNYGEVSEEYENNFDFDRAMALEKLDGSMLSIFFYDGEWLMSTRKVIGGGNPVDERITYLQLVENILGLKKDQWNKKFIKGYNYVFELISPENRIVTPYNTRELVLLTARDWNEMSEVSYKEMISLAKQMGFRTPKTYSFNNIEELKKIVCNFNELDEGVVVVDYTNCYNCDLKSYKRIKVKNPSYLAIAKIKDSGEKSSSMIDLILDNDYDEFLSYFPEFKEEIFNLKNKIDNFKKSFNEKFDSMKELFLLEKTSENRKNFALSIKDYPLKSILFDIYNNRCKDLDEWIEQQRIRKSSKFSKDFLEMIENNEGKKLQI